MQNTISIQRGVFTDGKGRERIFNGVNIVDKNAAYLKEREFKKTWNDKTLQKLKNLGFNLIRLGFTWAAIEPEPGTYNEAYLQMLDKAVAYCEKYGFYFYLDCHQDLYTGGGLKGFGDGAPEWAVLDEGKPCYKPALIWAEGYFYGKSTMQAFQSFWENRPVKGKGLQDRFAEMWKMLAARYGENPHCFGFDFLNEPYPGNSGNKVFTTIVESAVELVQRDCHLPAPKLNLAAEFKEGSPKEFFKVFGKVAKFFKKSNFRKTFLKRFQSVEGFHEMVLPALPYLEVFDKHYYTPFLEKMTEAVRSVTDKGIILMENSYFSNLGIPYSAEKPTGESQVAFAPHGYDIWVDSPLYDYANNNRAYSIFREHSRSQQRLQVPVVVGEFGGGAKGTKWLSHVDFLMDYFNEQKWSSTYWVFSDRIFNEHIAPHIARPYPQAICGELLSFQQDRTEDSFTVRFVTKETYKDANTEIFLYKAPKQIFCDAPYRLEPSSENTAKLYIEPILGEHEVKVYF